MRIRVFLLMAICASGLHHSEALASSSLDNCTYGRMDDPGGSMAEVPVLDQGDVGLCYAYAAAQMMDAWRFTHIPKNIAADPKRKQEYLSRHTSALRAGVGYAANQNFRECENSSTRDSLPFEGGLVCETLENIKASGSCSAESVEAFVDDAIQRQLYPDAIFESIGESDFLSDSSRRQKLSSVFPRPPTWNLRVQLCNMNNEQVGDQEEHCAKSGNIINSKSLMLDFVNVFDKTDLSLGLGEFKQKLDEGPCKSVEKFGGPLESSSPPECKERYVTPKNKIAFKEKLEKYLRVKENQPLQINFCSAILSTEEEHRQKNEPIPPNNIWISQSSMDKNCGYHAVLLIGQKRVGNSCKFLIRNSWGLDCGGAGDPSNCDHGDMWVDADTLLNNTGSIGQYSGSK